MATIRFFIRTVTKDKNTLVPVYVRLRSGKTIDITVKADILTKPDNWSNETQQAKQRADVFKHKTGNTEETGRKAFNDKINGLRSMIEAKLIKIHQSDITAQWLKDIIDRHWYPEKYRINLFGYIEKFIEISKTRPNPQTGRPVSYRTINEYDTTFTALKDFSKHIKKDIDFQNIDMAFYDGFIQFLQKKKLALNTIGKRIKTLKIFLNAARDEGLNKYDAFKSKKFVRMEEESDSIALDERELTKIYEHDLSGKPGAERVRDLFLVGCYTGCRFSDIGQITTDNIHDGMIHLEQIKTGTKVVIPMHPVVSAILNKYSGKLPQAISNQKFNVALKEIAEEAKINDTIHKAITKGGVKVSKAYKKHELVTTHTARRSFATNLYKSDFPTLSIMAITGHKTEESFLKYIKVTPDEHAKKLQIHWNKPHLKIV